MATSLRVSECPHPETDIQWLHDSPAGYGGRVEWCARCGSLSQAQYPGERDWQTPQRGLPLMVSPAVPNGAGGSPIPLVSPVLSAEVMALVEANKGIFLDVGCSDHKSAGSVGMDIRAVEGVDIVHSLLDIPWPLPEACCKRILASHIIEHLDPSKMVDILNEMHRVMQPGGQLLIAMPYAGSHRFWMDPTHIHAWNEATPQYFSCDFPLWQVYRPQCWHIDENWWDSIGDLHVVLSKRIDKHGQYHQDAR